MQVNNNKILHFNTNNGFLSKTFASNSETNIFEMKGFIYKNLNEKEEKITDLKTDYKSAVENYETEDIEIEENPIPVYNAKAAKGSEKNKISSEYVSTPTRNGKIDAIKQQETGNCWLLSGVNALSYNEKGREIIKNALEYKDDGVIVHLYGTDDYYISNNAIKEARNSSYYSKGDDDMICIELAIENFRDNIAEGKKAWSADSPEYMTNANLINETTEGKSSTKGGKQAEIIYLLTGKLSEFTDTPEKNEQLLNKFIKDKDNCAFCCSSLKNTIVKDPEGNETKIFALHAYAVKEVSDKNITVIDPYDATKNIVLDRDTFLNTFGSLTLTDLTSKSNNNIIINNTKITENTNKDGVTKKNVLDNTGRKLYEIAEDKNNNILNYNKYDIDGNLVISIEHKYDANNNQIFYSEKFYDNNELVTRNVTEYYADGTCKSKLNENIKNENTYTEINSAKYSPNGFITEIKSEWEIDNIGKKGLYITKFDSEQNKKYEYKKIKEGNITNVSVDYNGDNVTDCEYRLTD